ncbi:hypothetical protein [Sinimarinibacterium flocculans]|uniref:hypothetical protein n=1 Tax=Sinimarinibacterium flocculans TaxID=985250 RepID=UPI002493946B|nr:hypothetical protein [Sinimarinibacterium flocculans]
MRKFYVSTPAGDESCDYHLPIYDDDAETPKEAAEYFASTFNGSAVPPSTVYVIECDTGYLHRFKIERPRRYMVTPA